MAPTVIEGTWEEIVQHSAELAGRRVRVQVMPQLSPADTCQAPSPAERFALAHKRATELEAEMPLAERGDVVKLVREARSGPVYGLEPVED